MLGDEPGGLPGFYSFVGGILGDFRPIGGIGRCGCCIGIGGCGSPGAFNRQQSGLGIHRAVFVPEVAVEPISVQFGRNVRQFHRIVFTVVDIEIRELFCQDVIAVFIFGIDRDVLAVRTDKMPAGEISTFVIGDKPAGTTDLNFFIRRIFGDNRGTGSGCRRSGSRGRRDRWRRCCGNLGDGCRCSGCHRHGGWAAGRSRTNRRRTHYERGSTLIHVVSERHGVGKGGGIAADIREVIGPDQVLAGNGETAGAAGRNQTVRLSMSFIRRLLHHYRIVVDDGLLLGIIGTGHLPVSALRCTAGPVDRDGGGLRILGSQPERAAMRELLRIDAFQIHHVYRALYRNSGIGSNIRTVFLQKGKRQTAGTEQYTANETKQGKIQKSLFQNVQSSF